MRRALCVLFAAVALAAFAPRERPVADTVWLSETFAAGMPLSAPTYPWLIWNQDMEVVGGQAVPTTVTNPLPYPYVSSQRRLEWSVMPAALPAISYPPTPTPNAPGDVLFLQADVTFHVRPVDYGGGDIENEIPTWSYQSIVGLGAGATPPMSLYLNPDGSGNYWICVYIDKQSPAIYTSRLFTQAELATGSPITIRLEWRGSSNAGATSSSPTPAADGYVKVIVGSETVINQTGVALWIGAYNKIVDWASFDGGLACDYDNLEVGTVIPEVWVDVADFEIHTLDAAQYPGGIARVVCKICAPGDDAHPGPLATKPRLVSLLTDEETVDAVVGTGPEVTSATPADASFLATLTGIKPHKLQQTAPATETDLWCMPGAEVQS